MAFEELSSVESNALCLRIVLEEGLLSKRLLFHNDKYPESSAQLALVVAPFLAFIAYSMPAFIETAFHVKVKDAPTEIEMIRHRMKSLDLKHITYEEYFWAADTIVTSARQHFAGRKGFLGRVLNRCVPDVGVTYYSNLPIYSTFATTYNLFGADIPLRVPERSEFIGLSLGETLSFAAALAGEYYPAQRMVVPEFVTSSNDFRFTSLLGRFAGCNREGMAVFFLLTERMTTLSSVNALRQGGFLDDFLWIKLETVVLYHTYKSLTNLIGYLYRSRLELGFPLDTIKGIQDLTTHKEKQTLKKMRKLRNAFTHYDFGLQKVHDGVDLNPWKTLRKSVQNTIGMSDVEYIQFLVHTHQELVARLQELLKFPSYSVWRGLIGA